MGRPGGPIEGHVASLPSCADDEHPAGLVRRAKAFNLHEAAFITLAGGDDALAVRGATHEAVVAALMLAAAPTAFDGPFTKKVERLAAFTADLDEPRRSYVADLLDAALAADAATRIAAGLAPPGRRFSGWVRSGMPAAAGPRRWAPPDETLSRYAARAGAGDPDYVLITAIEAVRELLPLPSHGRGAEAGYDAIERSALSLCTDPPASGAERDDARPIVSILWLALRRRRPLAAAVLHMKLSLDRARWGARRRGG